MIVFIFFLLNKDGRERIFDESFLLADIKLDVVLGMPFLTISNADVDFQAWDLNRDPTPLDTYFQPPDESS